MSLTSLSFTLTGCAKKAPDSQVKRSDYIRACFDKPIESLNPTYADSYPTIRAIQMLYEGLMRMDKDGRHVVYGVAEKYTISEDQKTYTFYLRDAKWSNGDPLTAFDFEYAWKKQLSPHFKGNGEKTFYMIKHVQAYLRGKANIEEVGIRALNSKTFQVELEAPFPYFLHLVSFVDCAPIHRALDQRNKEWGGKVDAQFICNGPFIPKLWKKREKLVLEKNPNYWDADSVQLSGIELQIIPNSSTQFYLYEQGELDYVGEPMSRLATDLLENHPLKEYLEQTPSSRTKCLTINTKHPYLGNANLRKALALAIDRKALGDHVIKLNPIPATRLLNPCFGLKKCSYYEDGAIEEANRYLNKALKELDITKDDLSTLTLSHQALALSSNLMQAIQEQWRKALGIHIQLDPVEPSSYLQRLLDRTYQIGEIAWTARSLDPSFMLRNFCVQNSNDNLPQWENPSYQSYMEKAYEETDLALKEEQLLRAEALLMEKMPVIPLYFTQVSYLKNPKLKGVVFSPLGQMEFRYAHFD